MLFQFFAVTQETWLHNFRKTVGSTIFYFILDPVNCLKGICFSSVAARFPQS
uniref:Uncharacterized protein n=1 Tax=Anguilla anguilla TaxID=7936 RepID=A0A0E9XCM2_ANGAN